MKGADARFCDFRAIEFPLDDRALIHKNGQFKLLGRIDRTIKIEEKRLNLDELENYLQSMTG